MGGIDLLVAVLIPYYVVGVHLSLSVHCENIIS